jgi:hypothetical protein
VKFDLATGSTAASGNLEEGEGTRRKCERCSEIDLATGSAAPA